MLYQQQHDFHLIPWLKVKFNLTVQDNDMAYSQKEWWWAWEGDYDLDIKAVTHGPSIFATALEYSACHNTEMNDRLVDLEMGDVVTTKNGWGLVPEDCMYICLGTGEAGYGSTPAKAIQDYYKCNQTRQ